MTGCPSNSHGDFKKRFSLGVMADVKTLTDLEVPFINEHFEGVSFENDYWELSGIRSDFAKIPCD